ncbi:MAG: carboxypeptidase-like regulatory domain-containing protein [Planctomycetes bacterium]|nr:carboxypeptidase-like regulatory domain-containing protein [Planctomycetota bacterium]
MVLVAVLGVVAWRLFGGAREAQLSPLVATRDATPSPASTANELAPPEGETRRASSTDDEPPPAFVRPEWSYAGPARAIGSIPFESQWVEARFFGRALDAETLRPIPGARAAVRRGAWSSGQNADDDPAFPQAFAAGDGVFELVGSKRTGWQPTVRVEAEGYGPRYVPMRDGHDTPDQAVEVRLIRGGTLDVLALGDFGAFEGPFTVNLRVDGVALAVEASGANPFEVGLHSWRVVLDAAGRARIEDLPARTPIGVEVRAFTTVLAHSADPIVLAPGEERRLEFTFGAGTTVRGTLRDPEGRPLADREVWRVARRDHSDAFSTSDIHEATATTDADGRFEFPRVGAGTHWFGPAPSWRESEPAAGSGLVGRPVRRTLSASERDVEVELTAYVGLSISGTVVDQAGAPIAHAVVTTQAPGVGALAAESGVDGSFVLGPLLPGECRLEASTRTEWRSRGPVSARAGARDVRLVLEPAATLVLSLEDERGTPTTAELRWRASDDAERRWWRAPGGPEVELGGFGACIVEFVATNADGAIGFARIAVDPRANPTRARVVLRRGGRLKLVTRENRELSVAITSDEFALADVDVGAHAPTWIVVPAAPLTLAWRSHANGTEKRRDVQLVVGETLELDLDAP